MNHKFPITLYVTQSHVAALLARVSDHVALVIPGYNCPSGVPRDFFVSFWKKPRSRTFIGLHSVADRISYPDTDIFSPEKRSREQRIDERDVDCGIVNNGRIQSGGSMLLSPLLPSGINSVYLPPVKFHHHGRNALVIISWKPIGKWFSVGACVVRVLCRAHTVCAPRVRPCLSWPRRNCV